jgi:hypothetical protein
MLRRPTMVREIAEPARGAVHERVEQAHFDVGMRVEGGERRVEAGDAVVVEEQAHPHTAGCRLAQLLEEQAPRDVVVPDVVLHVERALGGAREQHARGEGVARIEQRIHARAARVPASLGRNRAAERRALRVGKRLRDRAVLQRGKLAAGAQDERDRKKTTSPQSRAAHGAARALRNAA